MASIVDSVFEEILVNDSSANRGSLQRQTCCSVIDGKIQLKHAPASKRSDINKTIPSFFSLLFADLLSLHLVMLLMFFGLV